MKYLTIFYFIFWSSGLYAQTHSLTVSIPNLKSTIGKVQIGVYNKKETFPKDDKQYKLIIFDADTFSGTYVINNLPKGDYAIALMHDENADQICNSNIFGIPKEGYGFSKNYKPKLSAPTFDDCRINLNKDLAIVIKLIY